MDNKEMLLKQSMDRVSNAEYNLKHAVEWFLRDMQKCIDRQEVDTPDMVASVLISNLNSSLVRDIHEFYGAYREACNQKNLILGFIHAEKEEQK